MHGSIKNIKTGTVLNTITIPYAFKFLFSLYIITENRKVFVTFKVIFGTEAPWLETIYSA